MTSSRAPWDECTIPEWGFAPDGRSVRLTPADRQLVEDFAAWQGEACKHADTVIVKWTNAGGAICYRETCKGCGLKIGGQIKHADIAGRNVVLDVREHYEKVEDAYRQRRAGELRAMGDAAAERAQPGRRSDYSDYLASDEWKRKRALVLKRDGGICRGCLTRPASDVHHLNYGRLYNELAFDLISLCSACHYRAHKQ